MIRKNTFGNTGLEIPPIIFGTSALGNLYNALEYDVKKNIVSECFKHTDAPVYFDTAGKYGAGLALEMMGKIFKDLEIKSEDVMISNKLGWKRVALKGMEPTFERGVWKDLKYDAVQNISYEGILECFEQGIELLGYDYVPQLVSVHDPDEYVLNDEDGNKDKKIENIVNAYKALEKLKKDGRVKAIGIGAKDWEIIKEIEQEVELDWIMFANSMTIFKHPPELIEFMHNLNQKNIGIINSAVFHAGFLIGGDYFDYQEIKPDTKENKTIFKWREDFFELCKKYNIKPAIACVQFGFTAPGVVAISLNTSNPKRILSNVESATASVPEEFWKEMKNSGLIDKNYPYV